MSETRLPYTIADLQIGVPPLRLRHAFAEPPDQTNSIIRLIDLHMLVFVPIIVGAFKEGHSVSAH